MSAEVVDLGTFTRQWAVEGRRVAWLLGAGASASASVPTAGQVTLDLLARLVGQGVVDLVRTTSFDDLVEQAADQARASQSAPSRARLGIAALGDSARAGLALSDDDFPLLVKLHGDFRERELKNLESE